VTGAASDWCAWRAAAKATNSAAAAASRDALDDSVNRRGRRPAYWQYCSLRQRVELWPECASTVAVDAARVKVDGAPSPGQARLCHMNDGAIAP